MINNEPLSTLVWIIKHKLLSGADPGFQARGAHFKKIAPIGGRREICLGISCEKSRFYAKKVIFFPILGGARAGCAPPWIRPWLSTLGGRAYNIIDIDIDVRA